MITKITPAKAREILGPQPIIAIAERKMKVMGNMKIIPKTGKVISFQQDENARYTGEIAICDSLQEARYFAYTRIKHET